VSRPVRALAAALALAAAVPACQQRDLPPDAAYRALARAMADRDEEAAWALLSEGTRRRLEERARAAAAAAPGVVAPNARALLAGDAPLAVRPASSIQVREAGPDRAILEVEAPGAPVRAVVLVREGGAWRVDLPVQ
jgi:hypothetical protein